MLLYLIFVIIFITRITANGQCIKCSVPTLIYDDLKCTPQFSDENSCCPIEYDCSHIYNRPEGTCHLKGKYYKPGEGPDNEVVVGNCNRAICECGLNEVFKCIIPSDSCATFWVPDFMKPKQPLCGTLSCATELLNSDQINKYCAPYYLNTDDCCPRSWLCPSEEGVYIPAPIPPTALNPECQFGVRQMYVGEKYQHGLITCECVIPPFLTCRPSHNYETV